jgi:hypothetical protein
MKIQEGQDGAQMGAHVGDGAPNPALSPELNKEVEKNADGAIVDADGATEEALPEGVRPLKDGEEERLTSDMKLNMAVNVGAIDPDYKNKGQPDHLSPLHVLLSYPVMIDGKQYKKDMTIADVASVCHEANRQWCLLNGDDSQVPWDQAPDWQKESAIAGVIFLMKNPQVDVSAQHENWRKLKEAQGWTYGPVKDEDAKTHPCMVPFFELPQYQQLKDVLFRAVVFSLR